MRRAKLTAILIAVAIAAPLALAWPGAPLADSRSFEDQVEDKLRQGAEKIIEALEILLRSIPTYGPPRIDEDGNIIIPRRGGPLDKTPEDEPDDQPEDVPPEAIAT